MFNVPSVRSLSLFLLVSFASAPPRATAQGDATVVYPVRHAEKVDDSRDPPLSAAGRERAALLAHMLRDAGLTHVHSTDLERTRETAAPIAGLSGIEVGFYDGENLAGLAERLRATRGRHLVSGHSDTTPELVRLLGGETSDISDSEYDRLYVLRKTLNKTGVVSWYETTGEL